MQSCYCQELAALETETDMLKKAKALVRCKDAQSGLRMASTNVKQIAASAPSAAAGKAEIGEMLGFVKGLDEKMAALHDAIEKQGD